METVDSHAYAIPQGLLYALGGYVLLSMGDAVVKSMVLIWPATAIAALRYFFGAGGLGVVLFLREGRGGFRFANPLLQWARALMVSSSAVCFSIGVKLMPLGDATAITFIGPMLTALLSALLLGERATRPTILACVVAFAGVLIVLRPNIAAAGLAALATPFWIVAALFADQSGIPSMEIHWPDWSVVLRCAIVALLGCSAHALIFMATTRASAATIAPMTYVQLIVAMTIGALVFDDLPDLTSLVGSALIVGSGLYLWRSATPKRA